MISWRLLLSACLDYLTILCNVNFLLTAFSLLFLVIVAVVVLFSFVTGSYFAYFNCSFTVVVTCTLRAHSELGRIFVWGFPPFLSIDTFSPTCINLPTECALMKRKAPASAPNDVAKKLKGAHTPPDDQNGQQVRQFSVFISWYLFKFHYPMFSFCN